MAQAAPPSTPYGAPISIDAAKKAMAAAEAEAAKNNWGVAIAIVDSGANLVMLHRLDNAQLSSVRIAEQKARTAPSSAVRPRCSRTPWPAAASGFGC
jgi:glc operon protein GlcG